jgi:ATP-dependent DNA helicase RecG
MASLIRVNEPLIKACEAITAANVAITIPIAGDDERDFEVLLVRVERAANAPVTFRGVPYERVLNTTRVMPRSVYQRHLLETLHASDRWEIQAANGCKIQDLDLNELGVTIEESIRLGRLVDPGTRDPTSDHPTSDSDHSKGF